MNLKEVRTNNPTGRNQYTTGRVQKKKGDAIALRLSVGLDAAVRSIAEVEGKKLSDVIETLLAEAVADRFPCEREK